MLNYKDWVKLAWFLRASFIALSLQNLSRKKEEGKNDFNFQGQSRDSSSCRNAGIWTKDFNSIGGFEPATIGLVFWLKTRELHLATDQVIVYLLLAQ